MTIDEIHWLSILFETKNMTKAARSLFISQPALSQMLKRVEEELGFALFTRSNKGLAPTEKGLIFVEAARGIVDIYQNFQVKIDLYDKATLQEITIGLPPFLSACCSANALEQLNKAFPKTRFSVFEGSWNILKEKLRTGKIHIAVTTGPLKWNETVIQTFGCGQMVIFLRKGSAAASHVIQKDGKRWIDPAYLIEEPLALTKSDQATRRIAEMLMREAGIEPYVCHESRNIKTLYNYAEKGIATAVVPLIAEIIDMDRKNNLICYIPQKYSWSSICSCIVVLPETDQLIPKQIYDIIRKNVIYCNSYIK